MVRAEEVKCRSLTTRLFEERKSLLVGSDKIIFCNGAKCSFHIRFLMMNPKPAHNRVNDKPVSLAIVDDHVIRSQDSVPCLRAWRLSNVNNGCHDVWTMSKERIADRLYRGCICFDRPEWHVLEIDHVAISQSWVAVLRKPYDSATSELRSFKRTKTGICEEEKMETIKTT